MKHNNIFSGKFAKFLYNNNIKISFNTSNNLIKIINSKTKKKYNNSYIYNSCGVYRLKCSCNKFYIGKTNTNFYIRYKEYIFEINKNMLVLKSNFTRQILETKHRIGYNIDNDIDILYRKIIYIL